MPPEENRSARSALPHNKTSTSNYGNLGNTGSSPSVGLLSPNSNVGQGDLGIYFYLSKENCCSILIKLTTIMFILFILKSILFVKVTIYLKTLVGIYSFIILNGIRISKSALVCKTKFLCIHQFKNIKRNKTEK